MAMLMYFVIGLIFASGLAISGMVQPDKVIGFLDFFGDWDPTLMIVLGGAVSVNFVAFRLTVKRAKPLLATTFGIPTRRDIDLRLLGGGLVFGLGWGFSGFCPGPALVSLSTFGAPALVFVSAMIAGMYGFKAMQMWLARPT